MLDVVHDACVAREKPDDELALASARSLKRMTTVSWISAVHASIAAFAAACTSCAGPNRHGSAGLGVYLSSGMAANGSFRFPD